MQLRELTRRVSSRLREQDGFTMLMAVFTLTITTLLIGGAYMAVLDDTQLSRNSVDQNRAYAAAQAGIQAYNYQLNENENYWQTCTPLGPTTVPGSTDAGGGSETYTVKPMVASTAPSTDNHCDSSNALATMIEGASSGTAAGSFRIESTGASGNVSRTIVAQYKPPSFLQYVYYTDYETTDPSALPGDPGDCEFHYPNRGNDCGGPINFITNDSINGPLHSEDTLSICGSPVLGRTKADQIQAPNTVAESGGTCTNSPNMQGTYNQQAGSIAPPPDNAELLSVTQSAYHFTGKTTIVLSASNLTNPTNIPNTMTVTNANITGGSETVNFPSNGVVYVSTASAGCGVTYTPFNPSYTADTNCGNVYVSGAYSQPLTIASDDNIIIKGNITTPVNSSGVPTTNALLGLIADEFVRIYHPLSGSRGSSNGSCNGAANTTGDITNPTIYAAILAVAHSFIVDNYDCGATLGTLDVYGAIAQLFRGPVGTGGTEGATSGYLKSYNYDDRLDSEEPPYFLNPVSAQWYVSRETECAATSSSC
jgi:Tfp pilus assembly protein PilX